MGHIERVPRCRAMTIAIAKGIAEAKDWAPAPDTRRNPSSSTRRARTHFPRLSRKQRRNAQDVVPYL
jgi:hypothetical protein